jgi:hypothetical protein
MIGHHRVGRMFKAVPQLCLFAFVVAACDFDQGMSGSPDAASPLVTVSFGDAESSAGEASGTGTIAVMLSAASTSTVTVDFTVAGGTASRPEDFTLADSTLTFSPGQTMQMIAVAIESDDIDEPDETLLVQLARPVGATLGETTTHTLTIADDDPPPVVSFAHAAVDAGEAMTAVNLIVQLSSASGFTVTVPFSLDSSGTAETPDDFTLASTAALVIPPGATSASVVVNVKADALDEADETVIVVLATPTNATLGATSTATLTIVDDDPSPTVAFTSTGSAPNENNSNITLTVQLSDISGRDVTVPFSVDAASTASSPADYTITASPVTIPAGETSTTIIIAMKEDTDVEPDETVIVNLGTPTNATLGTPATYTLTIKNDD